MPRREFSRKTMAEAFNRANGNCEECTAKLMTGGIEYDHVVPCELGGEATLENCRVLCRACHKAKTAGDVRAIRKSDRQRDRHTGAKRSGHQWPSRPFNAPFQPRVRQLQDD